MAMLISALFSFLSQEILDTASLFGAFAVMLVIIAIGILFDVLGVAVTAADEKPFHSMAAKRVAGANEAIRLLRNADKMATICNDIIGDICGIISGTAAAVVAIRAFEKAPSVSHKLLQLLISALVAALTIGGKAMCKNFAMRHSTPIIHTCAKVIYYLKKPFRGKNPKGKR